MLLAESVMRPAPDLLTVPPEAEETTGRHEEVCHAVPVGHVPCAARALHRELAGDGRRGAVRLRRDIAIHRQRAHAGGDGGTFHIQPADDVIEVVELES